MDALIESLLACSDDGERKAILDTHRDTFSPAELVAALKARGDAHLRDEPAQARHLANIATSVADWCGQPKAHALAAWARANARYYQGHFPECLALYEKALTFFEQTEDTSSVARLRSNCSAVLSHLGRYEEALSHLEEARSILAPQGPSPYLAGLEMNLAMAYQQLDRYDEAVAACEWGREVALAIEDRARAARLDVNRAVALQGLDRFREAIDLLLATIPVLEDEGERLEVARAYLNLGWLRFHTGHYRQALIDLEIARQRFDELDNEMEVATADLHRAQVYLRLNLLPEAIELCQSAQAVFLGNREVLRYAALAEYYAGVAYGRLGERELALQYLTAARDRMSALGLPVQAARVDLERARLLLQTSEGSGELRSHDFGSLFEAQALAQAARDLFQTQGLTLRAAWAEIVLADAQSELGDQEDAHNTYTEALATLADVGPAEPRYRAWYGLGRLAEADGRTEEALAHYRRAIEVVTATATALGESELRAGFLHDKLDAFQAAVSLSLESGRDEEALALVELARAGGWLPPPDEGATTSDADAEVQRLRAEVQQLRETWHWHYNRLRERDAGRDPPPEQDAARETRTWTREMRAWRGLRSVERRLTDAVRTLRLHLNQAGSLPLPRPATPTEMAAHLTEGQCLLTYCVARDQIVAFVIRQTGCTTTTLPTAWPPVAQRVDRLLFSLHRQGTDTLIHLQWLWQVLLAPLEPYLTDCRQLIVVPHDRLHYLPFHALHNGTSYLLGRCQITYAPTLSLLKQTRGQGDKETRRHQMARWSPLHPVPPSPCLPFSPSPLALILACSDHGRLPGALVEGHAIRAALTSHVGQDAIGRGMPALPYNALLYLDTDATSARLRQHASDCALLHIAAHGRFRSDNPLFSALHLGDGPLLLADLNDLRLLEAPLVTLSACESGLGDLRGGDVLGLSRTFLHAGAGALLVSLWRVPDEATAHLMETFYRHLMAGVSPATALRQAQRALLNEKGYEHPRQWAGWMLVESGRGMMENGERSTESGKG